MTTVPASTTTQPIESTSTNKSWLGILLPYGLAILAQLPLLFLYFRGLWAKPHLQAFPFAIIATIVLVVMRWPRDNDMPFHRSIASDVLLIIGFGAAIMGAMFVEPWFAAFSVLMFVTSLLARTVDSETGRSLWPCALPMYVCMLLPLNYDTAIITNLQNYSAQFTSQLLDLIGMGHFMNGTVIIVPNVGEYGVEEACSGVVSFFTLLTITAIYVVWARRIAPPSPAVATIFVLAGVALCIFEYSTTGLGYWSVLGIGLILIGFLGFRAGVLMMSAVFWALFINTVRIMTIPLADYHLELDLSHGVAHDVLGYVALLFGVLLVLSTDQFLLFLFGPVEVTGEESGQFSKPITKFWNGFLAGGGKRKRRERKPVSKLGRTIIWAVALVVVGCGLFQLVDVQRSLAQPQYKLRFFDTDVTVDFEQDDIPEFIGGTWKRVGYETEDRARGSDFGTRSDMWQFQAPRSRPVASLDQTFPGWHELTRCYQGLGWNLLERTHHTPEAKEGEEPWAYIIATFEKDTGEKGYLLFSHFDAFGQPVAAPEQWGTINSFFVRARNRLSRRIRANLFDGETYQTQVFLQSYNGFDDEVKEEAKQRYLEIRDVMRQRFKEKRAAEDAS